MPCIGGGSSAAWLLAKTSTGISQREMNNFEIVLLRAASGKWREAQLNVIAVLSEIYGVRGPADVD